MYLIIGSLDIESCRLRNNGRGLSEERGLIFAMSLQGIVGE